MANIAHIREVRSIPLDDLEVGMGQARVSDVGKDISELADSIRKMGLLEPIVVAPSATPGKFEILTGQRRFLAHQELQADSIMAVILEKKVDETAAKAISLTENLVRRDLNRKDLIDACTSLYKHYGTIKDVAEETGLPYNKVQLYIKYDRLVPELKEMVDHNTVDLKTALRAQDAASVHGQTNVEEAITFAKEMAPMSGAQQEKLRRDREENPDEPAEDLIEQAKTGSKITQIVVTLSDTVHRGLRQYADEEGTKQDDAAAGLLQEALQGKGYLGG